MTINPKVIDIYHGDNVSADGFAKAHAFGIRGVIHKATQGAAMFDVTYPHRREAALAAGMLWGAYHFNTSESVAAQVKHFINYAKPDKDTLCALDLEDNKDSNMSMAQAKQFLETVDDTTGKLCALYSGNRIKELIAHADDATRGFFGKRKLWLCQYASAPRLVDYNGTPLPWANCWLWQYTDGEVGPLPHGVPGIQPHMDVNHYAGTDEELKAEWVA